MNLRPPLAQPLTLDFNLITVRNAARGRDLLGAASAAEVAVLRAVVGAGASNPMLTALQARVAALESAVAALPGLGDLPARVAALEAALALLSGLTSEAERLAAVEAALATVSQTRTVFCPDDGLTYQLRLVQVEGEITLDWNPYPAQVRLIDGLPTLADPPAELPDGTYDWLIAADGKRYSFEILTTDDGRLLDWQATS